MLSHNSIKVKLVFVITVVLVNLANYIFYVYYNPSTEALSVARRPIATGILGPDSVTMRKLINPVRDQHVQNVDKFRPEKISKKPNAKNQKLCSAIPLGLGPFSVDTTMFGVPIEDSNSIVIEGFNKIKSCIPRERAAVIVPIPEAAAYPTEFINYLHSFLRKQMLEYQVFVVKQCAGKPYHRGGLINAAFSELIKPRDTPFHCIIIHEPNILPVDTRNFYRCSWYPRQLVATLNKDDNVTSYETTFGGAIALTPEQFIKVNGFSNIYENSGVFLDMVKRITAVNYVIERTPSIIGKYISLKNTQITEEIASPAAQQSNLEDGLTSLAYAVEEYQPRDTCLYLRISLLDDKPQSMTLPAQSSKEHASTPAVAVENDNVII